MAVHPKQMHINHQGSTLLQALDAETQQAMMAWYHKKQQQEQVTNLYPAVRKQGICGAFVWLLLVGKSSSQSKRLQATPCIGCRLF